MRTIEEIEEVIADALDASNANADPSPYDYFLKTWTHAPGTPLARPLIIPVVHNFDFADGNLKTEDALKIYPELTNDEWIAYLLSFESETAG